MVETRTKLFEALIEYQFALKHITDKGTTNAQREKVFELHEKVSFYTSRLILQSIN